MDHYHPWPWSPGEQRWDLPKSETTKLAGNSEYEVGDPVPEEMHHNSIDSHGEESNCGHSEACPF